MENNNLMCSNCNVPEFTLNGTSCWGKIVYVYDGDTVHIVIDFNNNLTKFNCRLSGIDTKEMRSTNLNDKELAIKARNFLLSKITNDNLNNTSQSGVKRDIIDLCSKSRKLVWVNCLEFDKYGRLLVEIKDNPNADKSYNQELIDLGLAVPYFGGHKD
jgi:endonuclease YncB( thermonuclease family)